MTSGDKRIREKIITATLDCIGRDGVPSLTIRKIAKEAGVNSAAINYYFGTKEKLVDTALSQSLDEMAGLPEEILNDASLDPRTRLQKFFMAIMEGIFNYPGITTAHIFNPLFRGEYDSVFVRRFNAFIDDLVSKLKNSKINEQDLRIYAVQIISAILVPALMPKLFLSSADLDLEVIEKRKMYVDKLVGRFFV